MPHLKNTEKLLNEICLALNGTEGYVNITALEDLGIANNPIRMTGGFYTGMYARWQSEKPFIPIDTTINACGVSIYEMPEDLSFVEFCERISAAERIAAHKGINWNFCNGNHFILICKDTSSGKPYLVLHSSDNKYKYGKQGLYPREDVWYHNDIQILNNGDRYIRYISGECAIQFFEIYAKASKDNPLRNDEIASVILKKNSFDALIYSPHYGMPDLHSISIGCQWYGQIRVLLSATGKNIYIIDLGDNCDDLLTPHGFGVRVIKNCDIQYQKGKAYLNNSIMSGVDFVSKGNLKVRHQDEKINRSFIALYLGRVKFDIMNELRQLYSYSSKGYADFV